MRGLAGGDGLERELEQRAAQGDPDAALALDVFAHRVAGAVAAMAVASGGLDVLAFTAGIGEHSPHARAQVCERLGFLGVAIDAARNTAASGDCDVSAGSARVRVVVVRAREEIVAARAARTLLRGR